MVAVVFAFLHGNITRGMTVALVTAAAFSGVACVVSFLRLTQKHAMDESGVFRQ